jgi:hypothetical protein
VTRRIQGIPLGEALDKLLDGFELTWIVRDEIVQVTTPEVAESQAEVIVYRLKKPLKLDDLIGDITQNIQPQSWSNVGGPGDLAPYPPRALVIAQSQVVQREIQRHYADVMLPIRPAKPAMTPNLVPNVIAEALDGKVQLEVIEAPLSDVIDLLAEKGGQPIALDARALEDVGLSADCPVTISIKGISLRSALSLVLRPLELTWNADATGIQVTTPEVAATKLELVHYPVDDLTGGGNMASLIDVVQTIIAPQTWDRVGGPGGVRSGIRGTLDVRQTFDVQQQVSQLLADLRAARKP